MAQRRHHYERAFEAYLRLQRIPYVAVDEARKALLPEGAGFKVDSPGLSGVMVSQALKSFDFVLYGEGVNQLVDVKGRKVSRRMGGQSAVREAIGKAGPAVGQASGRLESWVTMDDVESLRAWRALFGEGFDAAFVFVYWCDEQPPDGLFQEVFDYQARWYALRAISLDAYAGAMKTRSPRWRTVDLPRREFEMLSQPFAPPWVGRGE
ncbi:MAG: HYExAFE family protein [Phycisphaerae bacterium]|nr:HYExAFE family protein [Phycisphaerae bacterium]